MSKFARKFKEMGKGKVAKINLVQLDYSEVISIEIDDKSYLIVSSQDFSKAKKEIKVSEILLIEDLKERFGRNLKLGDLLASLLGSLGISKVKIPSNFPDVLYNKLLDNWFEVSIFF